MKRIIFFAIPVMLLAACGSDEKKEDKKKETKAAKPHYEFAVVEKAGVSTTVKLPGQLTAYQEVSIFPKVNGYVKSVFVDIGSHVSKGQLLMTLEAPELEQAVLQAKERYTRSKADFSIDKERYFRLLEASRTAGAISPLDLSTVKAKVESDSALSNAEKANWQMQQTMMAYLQVTAPFDGVITERNVHPGALVSAAGKDNKPMLELKEVAHLRLAVDIPESMSAQLKDKDTISFFVSALAGKKMTGIISRKSDNINAQFRAERTEVDVWNKDGVLSPGMYADVLLYAKGTANALSVPKSAVITSTEKKYVIVVRDGKTVKVEVSTGNESADRIEITGALNAGEKVISNANDEIKEGTEIG